MVEGCKLNTCKNSPSPHVKLRCLENHTIYLTLNAIETSEQKLSLTPQAGNMTDSLLPTTSSSPKSAPMSTARREFHLMGVKETVMDAEWTEE